MDVASCILDGNADAVEFCPHDGFHNILASATYTLEEGDQPSRSGSVSLFSVDATESLHLIQSVQTAGVFDMKWCPVDSYREPLLAQADAAGCLALYNIELEHGLKNQGLILKETSSKKVSSSMCICVDWSHLPGSISIGQSDGSVSIVTLREEQLQIAQAWAAHEFELWTTAFDISQPELLYTGSDDCRFSCWDLRERPSQMVFQNTKVHKMGVCCIAQNPTKTNVLLTGSYDEFLRVWDVRSMSKPVVENSLGLGGGVWRIKHHPYVEGAVLAACMHNGFSIVEILNENVKILETYSKHNSLAYGADWQKGEFTSIGKTKHSLVATCSFYDRQLRLWHPKSLMVK